MRRLCICAIPWALLASVALGKESAEAGSKLKVPEMLFGFTSQIVGRRHGTSVTIPSAILAKSMPSERTMVVSAITGVGAAGVKMPHGDVASLRKGIAKDYRDLDDDPRFSSIISHLPRTLGWGEATSGKHYYLYVAPGAEKHRDAPLVIFLHGFGGNFKIYPWWLKSWADRNGWVVVYPTFGMGRWEKPGGAEVVRKAYGDVKGRIPGIDKRPVIFMGLSQGAIGLARVTTGAKIPFKGVAFISGASPSRYLRNIKGKHALVVIGQKDMPGMVKSAKAAVETLRRQGCKVRYVAFPDQDHFLLFRQKERVLKRLADWAREVAAPPKDAERSRATSDSKPVTSPKE